MRTTAPFMFLVALASCNASTATGGGAATSPDPWTRVAITWDSGPCDKACHQRVAFGRDAVVFSVDGHDKLMTIAPGDLERVSAIIDSPDFERA